MLKDDRQLLLMPFERDPMFPGGFNLSACTNNAVNVGKHIEFALPKCPDVQNTLNDVV